MIIDDKSIAKPPYSGPNDEPLPNVELSEDDIMAALYDLFTELEQEEDDRS